MAKKGTRSVADTGTQSAEERRREGEHRPSTIHHRPENRGPSIRDTACNEPGIHIHQRRRRGWQRRQRPQPLQTSEHPLAANGSGVGLPAGEQLQRPRAAVGVAGQLQGVRPPVQAVCRHGRSADRSCRLHPGFGRRRRRQPGLQPQHDPGKWPGLQRRLCVHLRQGSWEGPAWRAVQEHAVPRQGEQVPWQHRWKRQRQREPGRKRPPRPWPPRPPRPSQHPPVWLRAQGPGAPGPPRAPLRIPCRRQMAYRHV